MTQRITVADSGVLQDRVRPCPSASLRRRAIEEGVERLGDPELIALILGTPFASTARMTSVLADERGGATRLGRMGIAQLAEETGLGAAKAARLVAAVELGRRVVQQASLNTARRLVDHDAVVTWARPRLAPLDHEELWILALDGRHGLRAARCVASGGIHGLHVGIRDVLRVALHEAASTFVVVHNHPSGDPAPSDEDVAFTRALAAGADAVGTPLLDHVIVARRRSSSMRDLGLVPPAARP